MIVTIARNDTTKAGETVEVEERKSHSVFSTARTKAIGQMIALSPLKEKKSLIGRIPSQQSQSIIPHSCHLSLWRWQPLGLLRQIGRCHTRSSTTIRYRMPHLRNNQYQMLPPPKYSQTWSRSSTPQSYDPTTLPPPPKLEPGQIPERASEGPSGSRVNIINAISRGSNEPVHETKKQRKEYFRTVSHVSEGRCFRTTWSHVPISFTQADLRLQHYPHNDPLVIRANIGKNSVHFVGNDVGRILVDNGSSADILVWQCFVKMGFTETALN